MISATFWANSILLIINYKLYLVFVILQAVWVQGNGMTNHTMRDYSLPYNLFSSQSKWKHLYHYCDSRNNKIGSELKARYGWSNLTKNSPTLSTSTRLIWILWVLWSIHNVQFWEEIRKVCVAIFQGHQEMGTWILFACLLGAAFAMPVSKISSV